MSPQRLSRLGAGSAYTNQRAGSAFVGDGRALSVSNPVCGRPDAHPRPRRGELLGLGWQDVNLGAEEMWVRWQLQRREGPSAPAYDQDIGLGGPLPLPNICLDALRFHQDFVEKRRIEAGEAWHDSG